MIIYQITDLHVSSEEDEQARVHFLQIIDFIRKAPPDLLVITGDLALPDGSESYTWIKDHLPDDVDYVVIPGNHDDCNKLFDVFHNSIVPSPDFFFTIALDEIDLIFANTSTGSLPQIQLQYIRSNTFRENSILFLHHPTKVLSNGFMDLNYPLKDIALVDEIISQSHIKYVFCGHFHTEYEVQEKYTLYVTPSPAFEINLHAEKFTFEKTRIPIRLINIGHRQVTTSVKYLDEG